MLIDYITGVLAAYENPALKLNSMRGFHGICKKIVILLLVATSHELEKATGIPAIESLVVWFFLGNEGLSILENAAKAGVPIPSKLRDTLEQLTKEEGRSPFGKQTKETRTSPRAPRRRRLPRTCTTQRNLSLRDSRRPSKKRRERKNDGN